MFQFHFVLTILSISTFFTQTKSEYPICDGRPASDEVESVIDQNIDRLMALRRPGWGWLNTPRVVLSIQLTKQRSFFGKNYSLERMEEEFRHEVDTMNIGKMALYALAIRSVCGDPRSFAGVNVLQLIYHRLERQWSYEGRKNRRIPRDLWYNYALAVQALCLSGVEIGRYQIFRVIRSQNDDGSYGGGDGSYEGTAQMLLAWKCLKTQRIYRRRQYPRRVINEAVTKSVAYLESVVTQQNNTVWIGNRFSTPIVLQALSENGVFSKSSSWLCGNATRSVLRDELIRGSQAGLAQILPALRGVSVLSLTNAWRCKNFTDPIPSGYQPTFPPITFLDCEALRGGSSSSPYDRFNTGFMNVRLSVQLSTSASFSDPYNYTLVIRDVPVDSTLLQALVRAKCRKQLDFETASTTFGPFVTSVGGLTANSTLRQYWALLDATTGNFLSLGVAQYRLARNDHILFKLEQY